MRGHKGFNPHQNPHSDDQALLSKMNLSLLPSTKLPSKLVSETVGYVVNDTCYNEISFSDPIVQKLSIQKLLFLPVP